MKATQQLWFGFLLLGVVVLLFAHEVQSKKHPNVENQIVPNLDHLHRLLKGSEDNATLISFVDFAKRFEKSYPSEKEMLYRLQVFKDGVARAKKMDEESRLMGSTATFGITKFSDITQEEFKSQYLMKKMPEIPPEKRWPNHFPSNKSLVDRKGAAAPAFFDWAVHVPQVVSFVYNQGQCGSCWAFSATENHESVWAIQHGASVVDMSVQQIIDCDDPFTYGCNGGWPYQAWEYISDQGGQDELSYYPYEGYYSGSCKWNGDYSAGSVAGWSWIYPGNEPAMIGWLYGNAPISICVDASTWSYYTGGVMSPGQCAGQIDHCVLATGWNFNNNPPYWNVRNSWGTNWGIGGYIELAYDSNCCGMASYPASCNTV